MLTKININVITKNFIDKEIIFHNITIAIINYFIKGFESIKFDKRKNSITKRSIDKNFNKKKLL